MIYLIECALCNYKPYVGKNEHPSSLRTNNHRSDSKKTDSIPVDQHCGQPGHDFTILAPSPLFISSSDLSDVTTEGHRNKTI